MRLLFAAATTMEVVPFLSFLNKNFVKNKDEIYKKETLEIKMCFTGIGMMATSFSLLEGISEFKPDMAIQAGIAGVFDKKYQLGDIVLVGSETLGDLGAESNLGFLDVFDLELMSEKNIFYEKQLINPYPIDTIFPQLNKVKGLSVNTVSGKLATISKRIKKFDCDIETMEGAAFHFVCLKKKVPFLQVRSISNNIELRDKGKWEMDIAIKNLNDWLVLNVMKFRLLFDH